MAYLPVQNQSVSGTVGASVLGLTPVNVTNFPVNPSISGTVAVSNFPTTQNVSGSVVASGTINVGNFPGITSLVSTVPSSVLVGASIIGLTPVSVSNFPTTQNVSGSVVAFPSGQYTVVSSIAGGIFPISGSVGAVVTNFPTTQNVSGSVVATQGTSPWITAVQASVGVAIISGSVAVTVTPPANQSVSGTVDIGTLPGVATNSNSVITVAQSSVAVAIVSGSIAATFTPPANQSVSGAVSVSNFPTTQNVSGSVVSFQGTSPWVTAVQASVGVAIVSGSIAATFTPPANQSVSGTVDIGTMPGVVTNSASVITVGQGSVAVAIVSGSIAATFTPPANQSVSGAVSISNFPTTQNVSGSVVSFQGTSPWIITGSVQGGGAGVQYAEDDVVPSVTGTAFMFRKSQDSSIMEVVNPLAPLPVNVLGNPSISGTVLVGNTNVNVSGSVVATGTVGASIIGLTPINVTNTNLNVGGSVVAFQGTSPWQISSVYGNISGSIAGTYANSDTPSTVTGVAMMFKQNVVTSVMTEVSTTYPFPVSVMGLTPVNVSNTNLNVSGSVVAFGFPANQSVSGAVSVSNFPTTQNVSGSVVSFPAGTIITSLVSTVPSSVIFGASIFGLAPVNVTNTNINVSGSVVAFGFPTNQNVSGSVVAFISGTPNVNTAGSVVAFQGTSPWVIQSIVGTYAEDAGHTSGDKGLFALGVRNDTAASVTSADADYSPISLDAVGRTIIKPFAGEDATIISYNGSVVSGSVTLIQASVIGKKSYITDWAIANTGSVTQLVTFQGGDTSIVAFTIAPAGGGSNMKWNIPPKTTLSQDLAFKTTGTSSIVYVTVKGYQAQ